MKSARVSLQHRPFLTPIWISGIAAVVGLSCAFFILWFWGTADTTTIIVVLDAPSPAAGEARSLVLAKMLGDSALPAQIDAIYLPADADTRSGRQLAVRLGLKPEILTDYSKRVSRKALHDHAGGRVLVIGDAATAGAIISALTGQGNFVTAADASSQTLYIVTVPRIGDAGVLRINY